MTKVLLKRLRETQPVKLATAVLRSLGDSELASVVGGQRICQTNTATGGTDGGSDSDCAD